MSASVLLSLALQQQSMAGPILVMLLFFVGVYAFASFCLQRIAEKTNTDEAWWAWVPVLNVFLMLKIADKPLWWFLLFLIPFVNIVFIPMVWAAICQARDKSPWLVVLFFVPVANLGVLPYLAFSE